MKIALIAILCFAGATALQAQRFQRYYLPPATLFGNDVLTSGVDNTVIAGAAASGHFSESAAGVIQRRVRFVRINDDGSPAVNLSYRLMNTATSPTVDAYSNSMAGRVYSLGGVPQNYVLAGRVGTGSSADALFMALNSAGTVANTVRYTFGTGSVDEGTCIRQATAFGDQFYMCGHSTPANLTSANPKNVVVMRLNAAGGIQFCSSYTLLGSNTGTLYASATSLAEDPTPTNKVVWVVGKVVETVASTGVSTSSGLLAKVDGTTGTMLNVYVYGNIPGTTARIEGFKSIRRTAAGKFILLGTMNSLPGAATALGAGARGDVLMHLDLSGAAPVSIWQRAYNFNNSTAATVGNFSGTDVIEMKEVNGTLSFLVSGQYSVSKEKAVFKVDNNGNHLANTLYESGKVGIINGMAQTSDAKYPDELLGFGTSPNGNYSQSYIVKALPSLVTVTTTGCFQKSLKKYEVSINIYPTSLTNTRFSGTPTPMVTLSSQFNTSYCALEPTIAGVREAVDGVQSEIESDVLDFSKIAIYPNPSLNENSVQIRIETSQSEAIAEVLDFMGRRVKTGSYQIQAGAASFSLPTADLKSGNYLIRVRTEEGTRTARLLKN